MPLLSDRILGVLRVGAICMFTLGCVRHHARCNSGTTMAS
jgi:hypothetical protein